MILYYFAIITGGETKETYIRYRHVPVERTWKCEAGIVQELKESQQSLTIIIVIWEG